MSVAGHKNNDGGLGGATVAGIMPCTSVTRHSNNDGRCSGVANSATMVYTAARAQQNNNSTFVANVHGVPVIVPIIVAEVQVQEFTMKTLCAAAN